MISILRRGALAALAAISLGAAAHAQAADPNRLFADSRMVIRDRFSDEIVGKGRDLVFIPGLASSRATWKATAERLRGRYRLHLIQIAGFAGEPSRANATGEVLVPTAEAIDAYLVEQKLTPATMVGHSLGGTTLLYLAQKHPDHLRKVLIVDALPFLGAVQNPAATSDSVRPMAAKIRDGMTASAGPVTAASLEPQMKSMSKDAASVHMIAEWGAVSDRSVVGRAMYEDMTLDLRPGLASIKTPIVLLYPDNVPLGVPAGMMQKVYPMVYAPAPTVTPKLVANSQHFIMLDQPQAFAEALDAFLATP
ncbi:alpha/beta hydrolase [Phenylobacterium sp.]|uniref:alpha/beta fold hydrolase n=1 Tax=Phenylobacterium sp. TaxID=1871053 RepID=UPI002DF1D2C5|nr:alpha/beta hydrolase [Phenylobacterium sp.]